MLSSALLQCRALVFPQRFVSLLLIRKVKIRAVYIMHRFRTPQRNSLMCKPDRRLELSKLEKKRITHYLSILYHEAERSILSSLGRQSRHGAERHPEKRSAL